MRYYRSTHRTSCLEEICKAITLSLLVVIGAVAYFFQDDIVVGGIEFCDYMGWKGLSSVFLLVGIVITMRRADKNR